MASLEKNFLSQIFISDVVVGDFVLLQAGDKIPADGRLIAGEIEANQASLNGEQDAVRKVVAPIDYEAADKGNFLDSYLLFRGSVVDDGEGVMLVESVGKNTIYGQLHVDLMENEERESPLQVKLSDLADMVARVGYVGGTLIAVSFLFKQYVIDQGYSWDAIRAYLSLANWHVAFHDVLTSLILAIIVIVVAVPEGLPMMIAIVLSLNMRKLLQVNVLVRRLLGIETAGSMNVLFVDKTGTITKGIFLPQCFVTGNVNTFTTFESIPTPLRSILGFALRESTSAIIGPSGAVGGNASDRALLAFLDKKTLAESVHTTSTKEILFNSERKFSAVHLKLEKQFLGRSDIVLVKGAPELLLSHCKYFYNVDGKPTKLDSTEPIFHEIDQLSKSSIRVIAIATSETPLVDNDVPAPLTLVGVVGVMDEIRPESKPAIALAKAAGIQVVMITGDRKETAVAVASEMGLLTADKISVTSTQLKSLTDEQLQEKLPTIGVIARALPTDKSRLVRIAQGINKVVGMTGDGVNDSAALKKADVGFAMGSGSEVAKEAADIVILDDNFSSITQAVLYGRTIYKSIRKFIVFQSTVNCASLLIVFLGPFLGFDFPLTLIQLLWVNLVMDTLAALAFGGEPALDRYMKERPIRRDSPIISFSMWSSILVNGGFIAFLCTIFLTYDPVRELFLRDGKPDEEVFLTAFFTFFIFLTNFNAFNVRTVKTNIFDHMFDNRGIVIVVALIFTVQIVFTYIGGNFLRTVGLTTNEWILITGASMIIIPFDIMRKIVMSKVSPPSVMKSQVGTKDQ